MIIEVSYRDSGNDLKWSSVVKKLIQKLFGMPLILIILVIILVFGIQSGELDGARSILRDIGPGYTLLCLLLFSGYLFFDALGIHSALKRQGYHLPFRKSLLITVRGQYYYYITPGASGGQPMQIYYLREMGIPAGVGTSVLVCHFAAFQSMLAVLMTLFAIPYWSYIRTNIQPHFVLLVIGYLVNAGIVAFTLLFSFSRKLVRLIISAVVGLSAKLHLSRHPEALRRRLTATADLFHDSMNLMLQHPLEIFRQLFLGGIQQLLLMSVVYVIYLGLGKGGASMPEVIAMALAQYISAAYVPIPGASGAQEGVFSLYFHEIFPGTKCFAAMLIWRVTTFYIPLVVSALSIILYRRHGGKSRKAIEAEEGISR